MPITTSTVLHYLHDTIIVYLAKRCSVKDHHYLVVVDVGCNNQPVTRKGEWIIICRGVVTVVCTDDNTRVNDDESTTVSILYYHSLTAKDTIRGDLT